MKKILFLIPKMNNAGTEQALLNFLSVIDKSKYKITIGLVSNEGVWQHRIPSECESFQIPMTEKLRKRLLLGGTKANIFCKLKRGNLFGAIKIYFDSRIFKKFNAATNVKWDKIEQLQDEYELAVCYMVHEPFLFDYCALKVKANKKVAFVHNDFATTGYDLGRSKYINRYDHFYTVSEKLKKELSEFANESKISVFHNIVPVDTIRTKAEQEFDNPYSKENINLLSIGRLNHQKGFDLALDVLSILKREYNNIKWYIVGTGELEQELKDKSDKLGLTDDFVFLGATDNPYPYIKHCDIYVQPSRHEGYCTTVNEARVLSKPIVATDVSGTLEMLTNNATGLVTKIDVTDISDAIKKLVEDESLRKKFKNNLQNIEFVNNEMLEEFLNI